MNYEQAEDTILKAMKTLNSTERGNLAYHLKKGTPILCGEQAALYMDGSGGG